MEDKFANILDWFPEFLRVEAPGAVDKIRITIGYGLKLYLKEKAELDADKEVYQQPVEKLREWADKFTTDEEWAHIDRQEAGLYVKALHLLIKYFEQSDGCTISKREDTIFITTPKENVTEGESHEWHVTRYERSPQARQLCIEAYGNAYRCEVCGMTFADHYGPRQDHKTPYIEVHHIIQHAERSKLEGDHPVNYKTEMIPLCANCHRMIHFLGKETIHPDQLKDIWNNHHKNEKS